VLRSEPRTTSKHLAKLCAYGYLKINGGNKHRGGFIYEVNAASDSKESLLNETDLCIKQVMERVWAVYEQRQTPVGTVGTK
jgi:hypothetical protein